MSQFVMRRDFLSVEMLVNESREHALDHGRAQKKGRFIIIKSRELCICENKGETKP